MLEKKCITFVIQRVYEIYYLVHRNIIDGHCTHVTTVFLPQFRFVTMSMIVEDESTFHEIYYHVLV